VYYAFALAIVVLITPILSGVADYLGNKKRFLTIFLLLGFFILHESYSFFNKEHLELSFISFYYSNHWFLG
jgi:UMF1 family MFS transporter